MYPPHFFIGIATFEARASEVEVQQCKARRPSAGREQAESGSWEQKICQWWWNCEGLYIFISSYDRKSYDWSVIEVKMSVCRADHKKQNKTE